MNPNNCKLCRQLCDPIDPEYCVWNGNRWHVSCALKQSTKDIGVLREKQGKPTTTAANYASLQAKIDDAMDQREGLLKIMQGVPHQTHQLGLLFMQNEKLVKRDRVGHLVENAIDPRTALGAGDCGQNLLCRA